MTEPLNWTDISWPQLKINKYSTSSIKREEDWKTGGRRPKKWEQGMQIFMPELMPTREYSPQSSLWTVRWMGASPCGRHQVSLQPLQCWHNDPPNKVDTVAGIEVTHKAIQAVTHQGWSTYCHCAHPLIWYYFSERLVKCMVADPLHWTLSTLEGTGIIIGQFLLNAAPGAYTCLTYQHVVSHDKGFIFQQTTCDKGHWNTRFIVLTMNPINQSCWPNRLGGKSFKGASETPV